eukprot:scaffold1146_cov399-Prasinococcus_capsulatus_cf.AAC.15
MRIYVYSDIFHRLHAFPLPRSPPPPGRSLPGASVAGTEQGGGAPALPLLLPRPGPSRGRATTREASLAASGPSRSLARSLAGARGERRAAQEERAAGACAARTPAAEAPSIPAAGGACVAAAVGDGLIDRAGGPPAQERACQPLLAHRRPARGAAARADAAATAGGCNRGGWLASTFAGARSPGLTTAVAYSTSPGSGRRTVAASLLSRP